MAGREPLLRHLQDASDRLGFPEGEEGEAERAEWREMFGHLHGNARAAWGVDDVELPGQDLVERFPDILATCNLDAVRGLVREVRKDAGPKEREFLAFMMGMVAGGWMETRRVMRLRYRAERDAAATGSGAA